MIIYERASRVAHLLAARLEIVTEELERVQVQVVGGLFYKYKCSSDCINGGPSLLLFKKVPFLFLFSVPRFSLLGSWVELGLTFNICSF